MNRRLISPILVIPLMMLFVGCQQQSEQPMEPPVTTDNLLIAEEVSDCLCQLNEEAAEEIDLEITEIDGQLDTLYRKDAALNEMQSSIDYAVDYLNTELAEEKITTGGYWYYESPNEELELLSNEYYEFMELYMHWHARTETMEWKLTKLVTTVRDRETNATGPPETLINMVNNIKDRLIDEKYDKQNAKETAEQILIEATAQDDTWEINEVTENVYSVSGYGLGYDENKLSMGEWYYYEESDAIEAHSSASTELKDMITAKDR